MYVIKGYVFEDDVLVAEGNVHSDTLTLNTEGVYTRFICYRDAEYVKQVMVGSNPDALFNIEEL